MASATRRRPTRQRLRFENVAEFLEWLGDIPAWRVVYDPPAGQATRRDLLRIHAETGRRYELVQGILVENPMGSPESFLAMELGRLLGNFVADRDLGFLYGADSLIALRPRLVRGPDVCFVSWKRRPERTVPTEPISDLIPDLAVEVLSPSNTARELQKKLKEYFTAGVSVVWVIDPLKRIAEVHTAPDVKTSLDESGTLDGGDVLPGFRLPLSKLFERLEKPKAKKPRKKK